MFRLPKFRKTSTEQLIFQYVLEPLSEAYERVKQDEKMVYCDENTITKRLVWHLKHDPSLSYSQWKKTIFILWPKEQYTIDGIYEPDIKVIVGDMWMEIESKRIYEKNRWSVAEYLSKDRGIGRFLWGTYAHNEHGGMIGYIQKGDFHKVVQRIKAELQKVNCRKCEDIIKIENCVLSIHYRENKEDISIYHLFFYFS